MSFSFQGFADFCANARFQRQTAFKMPEARLFACLLHVHAKINQVQQRLGMALGLHIASHQTKRQPQIAVLEYHSRNQGVKGAFATFQFVGIIGIEGKARAAIVQNNASVARNQTGPEGAEDTLNKGNRVVIFIYDGQVNRVFAATRTWRNVTTRFAGINLLAKLAA